MSRRDRGVELAAVRMTEEFIVFGKVNHVGVDAYIDPSVQKRKRRNRRGEHCSPVPTPSPQLLRPSGTSSMRGGFIKIDLCIDKSSVLSYNIDKERAYQQTVCSHNVVKITARSCKQGRLFLFVC